MSTAPAAATSPTPFSPRAGNCAALFVILVLGCAGTTLSMLSRPPAAPISTTPSPVLRTVFASPPPSRSQALLDIDQTIAIAEAYYTDHRTYRGITANDFFHYGLDAATALPAEIYFATRTRYCVESEGGMRAWSKNGPFAPARPRLCSWLALEASPAPHDGQPPDLPPLPHQPPVPRWIFAAGGFFEFPEAGVTYSRGELPIVTAAARLERLAVRLNIFWINHRGSYTGAREPGLGIINAAGNNYCIEARVATTTLYKNGPSAPIKSSRLRGSASCTHS